MNKSLKALLAVGSCCMLLYFLSLPLSSEASFELCPAVPLDTLNLCSVPPLAEPLPEGMSEFSLGTLLVLGAPSKEKRGRVFNGQGQHAMDLFGGGALRFRSNDVRCQGFFFKIQSWALQLALLTHPPCPVTLWPCASFWLSATVQETNQSQHQHN